MKQMRVLVIENDYSNANMASIRDVLEELCGGTPRILKDAKFSAAMVQNEDPDLLLVDIALTVAEEDSINVETDGGNEPSPEFCAQLSGIRYCEKAKGAYPNVPLVLMSQFDRPNVIAASLAAGADGFLTKRTAGPAAIRSALKAAYMRGKTRDVAFYDELCRLLADDACWRRSDIQSACEEFFSRGAPGRRLVRLWVSLSDLVVPGIAEKLVTELIAVQVDAEALLLAANPRMRDHLAHSGNVFWLGYHLLNAAHGFRNCACTAAHTGAGVQSQFTDSKGHLHCAWILCSLLHDVAYLRDRLATVEHRLNTGRKFFGLSPVKVSDRVSAFPKEAMVSLRKYLSSGAFGVPGERLATGLTSVEAAWGTRFGGKDPFEDHGVVAAAALLDAIPEDERTAEVMHAAAAMALHNVPKWARDLGLDGNVVLPFELLPCANLLALCDELQGWGRELDRDPLSYTGRNLKDMRMHVKQGYVDGSHIAAFAVSERSGKTAVEVTIHYEMAPGEGSAGANLRTDITGWRTSRAADVSRVLKLSDHYSLIKIRHLIPDQKPEPEDVFLAGSP